MLYRPFPDGTPLSSASEALPESSRFEELRLAVLTGVTAKNSKRNYALALDELAAFSKQLEQPISRGLLLAFREAMLERKLGASTINVKLSAARKLVGEARRAGVISGEEASQMSDVPNIPQRGARLGNWLTREQAKELLAVPDRSTLKGKRDYGGPSRGSLVVQRPSEAYLFIVEAISQYGLPLPRRPHEAQAA